MNKENNVQFIFNVRLNIFIKTCPRSFDLMVLIIQLSFEN